MMLQHQLLLVMVIKTTPKTRSMVQSPEIHDSSRSLSERNGNGAPIRNRTAKGIVENWEHEYNFKDNGCDMKGSKKERKEKAETRPLKVKVTTHLEISKE